MRYLPLVLTRGPLLSQVIRESHQDPRRHGLCSCCGGRIYIQPARPDAPVRCPACLRLQQVTPERDTPWRLTATSAEALRRTKSWTRSC